METILNDLRDRYNDGGLVLALGAGTSSGSSLPLWSELVGRLVERSTGSSELFEQLVLAGHDLSAIASFVRTKYDNQVDFAQSVRECLYKEFPFSGVNITGADRQKFVTYVQDSNPTLRAIAGMCVVPVEPVRGAMKLGFRANPRVKAIINFNLDTVLREYVEARYGRPSLLRTIEGAAAAPRTGATSMYYVHGNLRFDGRAGRPRKEGAYQLILTEGEYFDAFNDPTSIFTYSFMYLLREYSLVFVGLSMTDKNLRRLLHYSMEERRRASAKAGGRSDHESIPVRHFSLLKDPNDERLQEAVEKTLDALGVGVYWYPSHESIPDLMRGIYESAELNWQDVYD